MCICLPAQHRYSTNLILCIDFTHKWCMALFQFDTLITHAHTHTITASSLVCVYGSAQRSGKWKTHTRPARTHAQTHKSLARPESSIPENEQCERWNSSICVNEMAWFVRVSVCLCVDISNRTYATNTPIRYNKCVCVCISCVFLFFHSLLSLCVRMAKSEEWKKRTHKIK